MTESSPKTAQAPAPSGEAGSGIASPRPLGAPRQPLWQAPVFVAGVTALLSVWLGRPLWPDSAVRRVERDLSAARQQLGRPDGDLEAALALARRGLEQADAHAPQRSGEANLLFGTACLRLADKAAAARALELRRTARDHLAAAEQLGVPARDRERLQYRLAKVGFHLHEGAAPGDMVRRLEETAPAADNQAEAYALLTQAYLSMRPPRYKKALDANKKVREVASASESEITEAQLLAGQVLLKMGKTEEARKSLELIPKHAAAELRVKARLLEARSYQEESKWDEAATRYQAALAAGPVPDAARVYYDLGTCFSQHGQPLEAARAWEDCVKRGKGAPETIAASLELADVLLKGTPGDEKAAEKAEKAVGYLHEAVAKVKKPEDWANPLADLDRARAGFERAIDALRESKSFNLAKDLVQDYERVALPGKVVVLRAALMADWARASPPDEARARFKEAAEACIAAAERPGVGEAEKCELLWAGVTHFLAAGEDASAVDKLERFLELEKDAGKLGEGHYRLAEAQRRLGSVAQAVVAYKGCIKYPTRFAFLARYELAQVELLAGNLDSAESALQLNLHQMKFEPCEEAQEKTLFALGGLLYQRRNFRAAVRPLAEALNRFKDNPEAIKARFQLADSYRQIASQETQNFLLGEYKTPETQEHYQLEHRRWLRKAAEEFDTLARFLESPKGKGHLTPEQRTVVPFITAKCWFYLGEYRRALEMNERLIKHYQGQVEELDALGGAIQCHAALKEKGMVIQRLLQIQQALPRQEEPVRRAWQQWINDVKGGGLEGA
jgi:hypothetical protein